MLNNVIRNFETSQDYEHYIHDLSIQNNAGVLIFTEQGNDINIIYNTTRAFNTEDHLKTINSILVNTNINQSASFIADERHNFKILFSAEKIQAENNIFYFCVSSPIAPVSTLTSNFRFLLIFISIGVLSLSLVGAYILSKHLSKPIQEIAQKAKEITSNNDVHFSATDYTEVEELSSALNYAISELKKTDTIRKEVLANVSHELKTPLTMIKSYTELIEDISGDNPTKRNEHLHVIHQEATRLEQLLGDMMDYSKLESGIITFNKTEFDLVDTLSRFYSIYEEKYKNFHFTLDVPDNCLIYADNSRIEQVITNLLNNAINYSKNIKEINIRLTLSNDTKFAKLEITDHGMGISKENLPHIFDRHFRTTNAKRATVGSGIGLSIVKSILVGHNFTYGVISEENKGSSFYINFPTLTNKGDNIWKNLNL